MNFKRLNGIPFLFFPPPHTANWKEMLSPLESTRIYFFLRLFIPHYDAWSYNKFKAICIHFINQSTVQHRYVYKVISTEQHELKFTNFIKYIWTPVASLKSIIVFLGHRIIYIYILFETPKTNIHNFWPLFFFFLSAETILA